MIFNEETLGGKNTTHATTMVVYQRKPFGPEPPPNFAADHSQRRRSFKAQGNVYEIQEFSAHRRTFWNILHVNQSEVNLHAHDDIHSTPVVPSWSAFNPMLFPSIPQPTTIGYCPMIDGLSTEFSTIYTVMKHAQKISSSIGQSDSVITFDLAIYAKAKQVQWRCREEFSDTVIHMGGFHIALNFLSLIGKKYTNSGLDLLIESGVYAAGTTSALMKGKCYNRGIKSQIGNGSVLSSTVEGIYLSGSVTSILNRSPLSEGNFMTRSQSAGLQCRTRELAKKTSKSLPLTCKRWWTYSKDSSKIRDPSPKCSHSGKSMVQW